MVHLPNGDTYFFHVVAEVFLGDTLSTYMYIICIVDVLGKSIDLRKYKFYILKK